MISNKLLEQRLNKAGYLQCSTTSGLWRHKWRPILFCLIVDDFGIEYVDKHHAEHLRDILLEHYEITQDWSGSQFAGIDLTWDYTNRTCRLSIKNYIKTFSLNGATPYHRNLSTLPFATHPSFMAPKRNSPTRRTPAPNLTTLVSNESKPSSAPSCIMVVQ